MDQEKHQDQSNFQEQQEQLKDQEQKYIEYSGLTNHGATCYMNTLLQTLFMTEEFRDKLFQWKYDSKVFDEQDCTPLQLQILFALMAQNKYKFCDTRSLIKSFQWEASEQFQQQDIQEFTRILFHTIEESCESTWINDIYQGAVENFVHCKKCNKESTRIEYFQDLSMTVRDLFENVYNNSLEKALKFYIKNEQLTGDNKYFCENCQEKQDATKGTRFKILPKILTFVLNRFELDYETFMRKKINHSVHFPFVLNMNKFLKDYDDIVPYDPPKLTPEQKKLQDEKEKQDNPVQSKKVLPQRKSSFDDQNKNKEEIEGIESNIKDDTIVQKQKQEQIDLIKQNNLTDNEEKQLKLDSLQALKKAKEDLDKKLPQKLEEKQQENQSKQQNEDKKKGVSFKINPALISEADECFEVDMDTFDLFDTGNVGQTNSTFAQEKDKQTEQQDDKEIEQIRKKREEENRKKWQDLLKIQKENQDQINKDIQEYLKEGEHVYELYAVNVHSGGAMGGHYYSHIKSFENDSWCTFNDTNVSQISYHTIESTYGVENPKFNAGSSAYMLSYRKVNIKDGKQVFTQPSQPPQYINEMIEKEKKRQIEDDERLKKVQSEFRKVITLTIFYKKTSVQVDINRTETLGDLMKLVKMAHGVSKDPKNWRLRGYSKNDDFMKQTYTGRENESLEDLKIENGRVLIVEEKENDQVFDEYDPEAIIIKVAQWKPNLISIDDIHVEPQTIIIRATNTTIYQLMEKIEKELNVPVENQILLKRLINNKDNKLSECYNDTEEKRQKTLQQLYFCNQMEIFLESTQDGKSTEGEWVKEFEKDKCRCIIKFNYPIAQNIKSQPEQPYQLSIDNRKTMNELKQQIAECLEIDINTFIIKKSSYSCEIKDMNSKIYENAYRNRGSIITQLGTPSRPGVYKFTFVIAQLAKENSDKITFDFQELPQEFQLMPVDQEILVYDLKKLLCDKLREHNIVDIVPEKIRLRDRLGERQNLLFCNEQTIKKQCKTLFDKKVFCITLLDDEEITSPSEILLYSKVWDIVNFQLSEPKEIIIQNYSKMGELGNLVSALHNIPVENLQGLNSSQISHCNFNKGHLFDISEEGWKDLMDNENQLSNNPWFCSDGALIVLRDKYVKVQNMSDLKDKYGKESNSQISKSIKDQDSKTKKKYVPEKAMKITIKKKNDNEDQKSESQQKLEENQQEDNSKENSDKCNGEQQNSDKEDQETDKNQEDKQQITEENEQEFKELVQKLDEQRRDCQQILEVQSITNKENKKQSQVIWELYIIVQEDASLYKGVHLDMAIVFDTKYLKGAFPHILIKQKLQHPNLQIDEEINEKIIGDIQTDFRDYNYYMADSLVNENIIIQGIQGAILVNQFLENLDDPNIDGEQYILNKELGRLYMKQDKSYYNLAIQQSVKEIIQQKKNQQEQQQK